MVSNPVLLAFHAPVSLSSPILSSTSVCKCKRLSQATHRRASTPSSLKQSHLPHSHRSKKPHTTPRCAAKGWDTLTASEFDEREASSSLAICFVGMSNCGKSHWSHQFKINCGFHVVSVDEEIERAIEPELTALGYYGIDGMAEWMGFPCDDRFANNQGVYLGYEETVTAATSPREGVNSILDTTGSVVYLKSDTLGKIRDEYLVVHLEASDDMLEYMTTNYFEMPKPVVWGDAYRPRVDEEPIRAMRRCYPDLLRERRKRYAAMAHVTVPAAISLSRQIKLEEFLHHVKSKLPQNVLL